MQITSFSDIGLRILVILCLHREDRITVSDLADILGKPHSSVVKAVHFMTKQGWIYSRRGRLGGIKLNFDPALMRTGDLLRVLEECVELIDSGKPESNLRDECAVRAVLNAGLSSFFDKLNEFSIADLAAAQSVSGGIFRPHYGALVRSPVTWP